MARGYGGCRGAGRGESRPSQRYSVVGGQVSGELHVGGLVGLNLRLVYLSRSSAAVTGMRPPLPPGTGIVITFGPIAPPFSEATIRASYATGSVDGSTASRSRFRRTFPMKRWPGRSRGSDPLRRAPGAAGLHSCRSGEPVSRGQRSGPRPGLYGADDGVVLTAPAPTPATGKSTSASTARTRST